MQKYNRFPKYLIPHSRNMFPHRVKYDEVAGTKGVSVCYIIVCQQVEKMRRSSVCEGINWGTNENEGLNWRTSLQTYPITYKSIQT